MPKPRALLQPTRSVAVRVVWKDTLLCSTVLRPPRDWTVGASSRCDFALPRSRLGTDELRIIELDGTIAWVPVPVGARAIVDRGQHTAHTYRTPPMPQGSVSSPSRVPLMLGSSVELRVGELTITADAGEYRRPYAVRRLPRKLVAAWVAVGCMHAAAGAVAASYRSDLDPDDLGAPSVKLISVRIATDWDHRQVTLCGFSDRQGVRWLTDDARVPWLPEPSKPVGNAAPIGDLPPNAACSARTTGLVTGRSEPQPAMDPKVEPVSVTALLPGEGSFHRVRQELEAGRLPTPGAIRVEDFLYALAHHEPTDNTQQQPPSVHVDATPMPGEPGRYLVRVVARAGLTRLFRRLLVLVESGRLREARAREPVLELIRRREGQVSVLAYGQSTVVRSPWVPSWSHLVDGYLAESGVVETTREAALEDALDVAVDASCDQGGTDVLVVFRTPGEVSYSRRSALVNTLRTTECSDVTLSWMQLGASPASQELVTAIAAQVPGYYLRMDGASRRQVFARPGDPLDPELVDVTLSMEFDPMAVVSYRLLGSESASNLAFEAEAGCMALSSMQSGEEVTSVYDVVLSSKGGLPLRAVLGYRVPGYSVESRVVAELERGAIYASWESAPRRTRHDLRVALLADVLRGSRRGTPWLRRQWAERDSGWKEERVLQRLSQLIP